MNSSDEMSEISTSGAALYKMNCAGCHGIDRKGNPPTYPALTNIREKYSKDKLRGIIRSGIRNMPSMGHLSNSQISMIVSYLIEGKEPGGQADRTQITKTEKGKMLYKSNCGGCHKAKPGGAEPKNAGTKMCNMMTPATLGGIDQQYSLEEFSDLLDRGICYMPSFEFLEKEDTEALYAYLEDLDVEWQGGPEHPSGGSEHPEHPSGGKGRSEHPSRQREHPEHPERKSDQSEYLKNKKSSLTIQEFADAAENYISEKSEKNGGYFLVEDEKHDKTLKLKLEKVHRKRLSYLGNKTYFVCADFKGTDGNIYDIDIFMKGTNKDNLVEAKPPMVHKVNNKPRFTWYEEDGIWKRRMKD